MNDLPGPCSVDGTLKPKLPGRDFLKRKGRADYDCSTCMCVDVQRSARSKLRNRDASILENWVSSD